MQNVSFRLMCIPPPASHEEEGDSVFEEAVSVTIQDFSEQSTGMDVQLVPISPTSPSFPSTTAAGTSLSSNKPASSQQALVDEGVDLAEGGQREAKTEMKKPLDALEMTERDVAVSGTCMSPSSIAVAGEGGSLANSEILPALPSNSNNRKSLDEKARAILSSRKSQHLTPPAPTSSASSAGSPAPIGSSPDSKLSQCQPPPVPIATDASRENVRFLVTVNIPQKIFSKCSDKSVMAEVELKRIQIIPLLFTQGINEQQSKVL